MKILWTVNLIPEEMSVHLGLATEVLGGWVESMANEIRKYENAELAIACKCGQNHSFSETVNSIHYYSLGYSSSSFRNL